LASLVQQLVEWSRCCVGISHFDISRAKFEELCMDLFRKCLPSVENVLKDTQIGKGKIH